MPPHLPLILCHKGRNNFSSADEEENLFYSNAFSRIIRSVCPNTQTQCKPVSGPQESQKLPQLFTVRVKEWMKETEVNRNDAAVAAKAFAEKDIKKAQAGEREVTLLSEEMKWLEK